jgi:hypothetical protein
MQLNLPILHLLEDCQKILIAGAGGGFDIFAGLPLYFTLREMGKTVHLANYTFSDFNLAKIISQPETLIETLLLGAQGTVKHPIMYYPEGFLAQWFEVERGEKVPIWMFAKTGVEPLTMCYKTLITHLGGVDALILVDGGVDSIMRGDEMGAGTLMEDTISLTAAEALDIPVKILACLGFGTEAEEAVCHYNALENMAMLARLGAFYGACALTPQMEAFQLYETACRYVWEQPKHAKSHISTRIIPAVNGAFGNFDMYGESHSPVLISLLMGLYWFFDATAVVKRNLLADDLRKTITAEDAFRICVQKRMKTNLRPYKSLPY